MSENSYRWRGELNHPGMISIISSNPDGPQGLPEKSFINRSLWNGITLPLHIVACWSQLAQRGQSLGTITPLLLTCCAGIATEMNSQQVVEYIKKGQGIGYHVRIDMYGDIRIFDIYESDEFQIYYSSFF
jgi:hypothetical protein